MTNIITDTVTFLTTTDEGSDAATSRLETLRKAELLEVAAQLQVAVSSRDRKDTICQRLVQATVGTREDAAAILDAPLDAALRQFLDAPLDAALRQFADAGGQGLSDRTSPKRPHLRLCRKLADLGYVEQCFSGVWMATDAGYAYFDPTDGRITRYFSIRRSEDFGRTWTCVDYTDSGVDGAEVPADGDYLRVGYLYSSKRDPQEIADQIAVRFALAARAGDTTSYQVLVWVGVPDGREPQGRWTLDATPTTVESPLKLACYVKANGPIDVLTPDGWFPFGRVEHGHYHTAVTVWADGGNEVAYDWRYAGPVPVRPAAPDQPHRDPSRVAPMAGQTRVVHGFWVRRFVGWEWHTREGWKVIAGSRQLPHSGVWVIATEGDSDEWHEPHYATIRPVVDPSPRRVTVGDAQRSNSDGCEHDCPTWFDGPFVPHLSPLAYYPFGGCTVHDPHDPQPEQTSPVRVTPATVAAAASRRRAATAVAIAARSTPTDRVITARIPTRVTALPAGTCVQVEGSHGITWQGRILSTIRDVVTRLVRYEVLRPGAAAPVICHGLQVTEIPDYGWGTTGWRHPVVVELSWRPAGGDAGWIRERSLFAEADTYRLADLRALAGHLAAEEADRLRVTVMATVSHVDPRQNRDCYAYATVEPTLVRSRGAAARLARI